MATQKLFVRGMTRESESAVERALTRLRGVTYATANHQDGCAEVEFDDDVVTTDAMREAIRALGFETGLAG